MLLLRRTSLHKLPPYHHRTLVDFAAIKHVRDRGLDHAVEREKHLKPVINLKNLLKSEPSKSLPISVISQKREDLEIPIRAIEFVRRYPFVFHEFLPGGIAVHPHIKLSSQVIELDSDEQLVYKSESYKLDVARRVLKLLMIARVDRIPLNLLDFIKWDLGLPQDFVESVVPEFPDYFRVVGNRDLELVCWSDEFAVPVVEEKARKGTSITFPMVFSKGFEMDKKVKKWFDEWQKLPYYSPYQNLKHLGPSTDESDRWTVGVLHELLNLFVSKKMERETLLRVGEWLGIRSRFKRTLLHHPGIFYLSSKLGTYTVVLKDAYKRGLLVEKSAVMDVRNRYLHLMSKVAEESASGGSKHRGKKTDRESKAQEEKDNNQDGREANNIDSDNSDNQYEHDEEEGQDEDNNRRHPDRNGRGRRGRVEMRRNMDTRGSRRKGGRERSVERNHNKTKDKVSPRDSKRTDMHMV